MVLLVPASSVRAQVTVAIARAGIDDGFTYRYAQVFHDRAGWVFPDVGYIDFGGSDYREFFAGFGRTFVRTPKAMVVGEAYYLQAFGSASRSEKYVLPWVLVALRLTERVSSETVYFPYVPLTAAGQFQHVLERSKIEYSVGRVKVGGGYGAYDSTGIEWQHRPFVTATVSPPRLGDFEVWLQRLPGRGVQVQIRYQRVFK